MFVLVSETKKTMSAIAIRMEKNKVADEEMELRVQLTNSHFSQSNIVV